MKPKIVLILFSFISEFTWIIFKLLDSITCCFSILVYWDYYRLLLWNFMLIHQQNSTHHNEDDYVHDDKNQTV